MTDELENSKRRLVLEYKQDGHSMYDKAAKLESVAECQQTGASVSAMSIAHDTNTNVVRKWFIGRGLKRMRDASPAAAETTAPAIQFVPVEPLRSQPSIVSPAAKPDIRST